MRRCIPLLVLLLVAVAAVPATATVPSGRFVDDDAIPGEVHLETLAEWGVIHGCNPPHNTRICPDGTLTRAEAAKILVRTGEYLGTLPAAPDDLPDAFSDDDTTWNGRASVFADRLRHAGVVHGCNPPDNTHFCPDDEPTRAELAKMTVGTLGLTAPATYVTPWGDTAGRWYAEEARIAGHHELLDASTGRFRGGDTMTRAEFATLVVRAAGQDRCLDDPFTEARRDDLARRHRSVTAYAYDTRTGCAYWLNPQLRLRTASVFKIMVMAGTLLEAQNADRAVTSWEMGQLRPMMAESTNPPVRSLWRSFGGAPWYRDQTRLFGLTETRIRGENGDEPWGRTETSGRDQANLIRQVLLGHGGPVGGPLEERYRDVAWDLMTSVVASQRWGASSGVPAGWTVAQKNGFAGGVANTAGFVRAPGSDDGYVVVILTNEWPTWQRGVPLVDEIGGWVSASLAR